MFCKKCGKKLAEDSKYCPDCGQPIESFLINNEKKELPGKETINLDNQEKVQKTGNGIRKTVSKITIGVLIVLLLMAFAGKFDSFFEKLGWGKADNVKRTAVTKDGVPVTYNNETGKYVADSENNNDKGELSSFLGCAEDELVEGCNFERNDYGTYPDIEHTIFICLDGQLNSISLQSINENSKSFTLFGIGVGDSVNSVSNKLSDNFFLMDSSEIENGMRDIYFENDKDNYLAIDYDNGGNIFGLAYTLGNEGVTESMPENQQGSAPLIYGTYCFDNGVDAICTADVGFTTDDECNDYIYISAMGYGGHQLTEFYGNVVMNSDGNYVAYSELYNTTIEIVFDETGMSIEILSCDDNAMMGCIVGKYLLTSTLNLNEVS